MSDTEVQHERNGIDLAIGRRFSRRSFLQALGASGAAAVGLSGSVLGATRDVETLDPIANQSGRGPIDDLAAALQFDREAIFRFVSEQIRYEPYAGVLRGPVGTLTSRAGNSADQAALLGALLDAAFVPYRFAWAGIDEATGADLTAAAVSDAATIRQQALDAILGAMPDGSVEAVPPPDDEVRRLSEASASASDATFRCAEDELSTTSSTLKQALDGVGIALPDSFTEVPPAELTQHVWVQAARGPDWLDLDPTLPRNAMGDALATEPITADELPAELYHRIELAVIGESLRDELPIEETLLRVSARAAELSGLPIVILNASPGGVAALGELIAPVEGVTRYVPTLLVGDDVFAGRGIQFGRTAGEDGFFGEDFFGSSETAGDSTAEWIVATISSPGREPVVVRREVFDRFGPAARASGELDVASLPPPEIVDLGAGQSREIAPAQAMTWLTVSTGLPSRADLAMHQSQDAPGAPAVLAHAHHVVRELTGLGPGLASGVRTFTDTPSITAFRSSIRAVPDSEPVMDASLDIWHRGHGTCPVEGATALELQRAVPGILAHVAERLLHGDLAVPDAATAIRPPTSVGGVFAAARDAGVGFSVLRSSAEAARLPYGPDAAARLERSLAEGWIAIAPERPVSVGGEERAGWWLVDPVHGRAVDELDDGRGAEGIEYAITLTPGQLAAEVLRQTVRRCMLGVVIIATGLLDFMLGSALLVEGAMSGSVGFAALGNAVSLGGAGVGAYGTGIAIGCAA